MLRSKNQWKNVLKVAAIAAVMGIAPLAARAETVDELQQKLSQTDRQLAEENDRYEVRVAKLGKSSKAGKDEIAAHNDRVNDIRTRRAALKDKIAEIQVTESTTQRVAGKLDSSQDVLAKLKVDHDARGAKLVQGSKAWEAENDRYTKEVRAVQERRATLKDQKNDIVRTQADNQRIENKLDDSAEQLAALRVSHEKRSAGLVQGSKAWEIENDRYMNEVRAVQARRDTLKDRREDNRETALAEKRIDDKLDSSADKLAALRADHDRRSANLVQGSKAWEQENDRYTAAVRDVQGHRVDLKDKKQEVATDQRQLLSLHGELDDIERKLASEQDLFRQNKAAMKDGSRAAQLENDRHADRVRALEDRKHDLREELAKAQRQSASAR